MISEKVKTSHEGETSVKKYKQMQIQIKLQIVYFST